MLPHGVPLITRYSTLPKEWVARHKTSPVLSARLVSTPAWCGLQTLTWETLRTRPSHKSMTSDMQFMEMRLTSNKILNL